MRKVRKEEDERKNEKRRNGRRVIKRDVKEVDHLSPQHGASSGCR
jgi:hypothetical protein